MDDEKQEPTETDIEESNPNAAGPQGLRGDMGVSSERTGPDGSTDGAMTTFGTTTSESDEVALDQEQATGPVMDDRQQKASQGWRDEQAEAGNDGPEEEVNPDEVAGHDSDPSRNPGHSHG